MDIGIMEISSIEIKIITAAEGHVLTNGETYSSVGGSVYLGKNDTAENWREITEEEYNAIMAAKEAEYDEEET